MTAATITRLPVKLMASVDFNSLKQDLLQKATLLTKETDQGIRIMKIGEEGYRNPNIIYQFISIPVAVDDTGFAPEDLASFPDGTIGMYVGKTHGVKDPAAWFVTKQSQGIISWTKQEEAGGKPRQSFVNCLEDFVQQGFAKVSPAG